MKKIYWLEVNGTKAYLHYDEERQTLRLKSHVVTIGKERLADFLNTAKVIGLKSGEV